MKEVGKTNRVVVKFSDDELDAVDDFQAAVARSKLRLADSTSPDGKAK